MTDTLTIEALTTDDVQALRGADSVSFHVYQGAAFVRAYLRDYDGRILTAREQRVFSGQHDSMLPDRIREIPCHWSAHGYSTTGSLGVAWRGEDSPNLAAFVSVGSAKYDRLWQTTSSLVSAGDTLTLLWTADNNTATVREGGLHVDELAMRATSANGKRERTFHVDTRITPDNSARMIRRYGH